MLADLGLDPTKPLFAGGEMKGPEFGSVGLHLIDIDEMMTKAPYEEQAQRLFARRTKVREQIPRERRWFERLDEATELFQYAGERPDDELVLEAILVSGEVSTLMDHACGRDVGDLMALFDAISQNTGAEREAAIARMQQMARDGRFSPPQDAA